MKTKEEFYTTYREAADWCNNSYILCNNITMVDSSVYDNARFNFCDEDDNPVEIFQWYLTDAGESDVEFLEKHFGLLFTYSDKLDCFVLCVDHLGTRWDSVPCELLTYSKENWDNYNCPHCKSYDELTK